MKKKTEREPDLIEFKIHYTLDDDLPVEKYFMAFNSNEALKSFAQSCIKFLSNSNLNELEAECFKSAYSNPEEPFIEKPEIIPIPDPIPPMDETEIQLIEEKKKKAIEKMPEEKTVMPDPFAENSDDSLNNTNEELEIFTQINKQTETVDPIAEHSILTAERENEINQVIEKNKKILKSYDDLNAKTKLRIQEINKRIHVSEFLEYFKWSDKWTDLDVPNHSTILD